MVKSINLRELREIEAKMRPQYDFAVEVIDEANLDHQHDPLFLSRVLEIRTADRWEFLQVYTVQEPRTGFMSPSYVTKVFAIFRRVKEKDESDNRQS